MDLQTVDTLLTTTRTVRKRLDFDRPVEREVIERCLKIAIQAPTGSNAQGWHFVVVTDADKKAKIGELYRQSFFIYANARGEQPLRHASPEQMQRVVSSSVYLANHMYRAPVLVIPCIEGRVENAGPMAQAGLYGSILPAAWSFMLALRARGLGAAWTSLHLRYEQEVAELLGLPKTITQAAMLPVAYFIGETFQPAKRRPLEEILHWDSWD
ncbi:MAG: nitroreductase family protein [Anaerolineales bacterium]|nr:nitroreductase family protein [Anaerolineales bacterium]